MTRFGLKSGKIVSTAPRLGFNTLALGTKACNALFKLIGLVAIVCATQECQHILRVLSNCSKCSGHKFPQQLAGKQSTAVIRNGIRQTGTGLFDDLAGRNAVFTQCFAINTFFDGGRCRKYDKRNVTFMCQMQSAFPGCRIRQYPRWEYACDDQNSCPGIEHSACCRQ